MLIADASCLIEIVTKSERAGLASARLDSDPDLGAPQILDIEVLGIIRRDERSGRLDPTAAELAFRNLRSWPGERFAHQLLLPRAWELRHTVRSWDAMYVALAETLGATLVTFDARLATASGPRCRIEVPS